MPAMMDTCSWMSLHVGIEPVSAAIVMMGARQIGYSVHNLTDALNAAV